MYIRETSDNGDYFEGSVNVFREAEGRGMCRYANGNVYEGNWQKDNWNGDGVLTYVNGFRFEGTFRDGYFEDLDDWGRASMGTAILRGISASRRRTAP